MKQKQFNQHIATLRRRIETLDQRLAERLPQGDALLKDWLIRHTLIEDRLYKDFLAAPTGAVPPAGKKDRRL